MNRIELVEKIAATAGLTKSQAEAAVNAFVGSVTEALKAGDKVTLKGFGTFETRAREERNGRNPRTGETMVIKASKAPAFKASSSLKKVVNEK